MPLYKRLKAVFYRNAGGREPVREWLLGLDKASRKQLGTAVLTVEIGWPLGMPTCRSLGDGLFEVRVDLAAGRTARILFCIEMGELYLLHGFFKKTQKTPRQDLELAVERKSEILERVLTARKAK